MTKDMMASFNRRAALITNIDALLPHPGTTLTCPACSARIPARTTGAGCIISSFNIGVIVMFAAVANPRVRHARARGRPRSARQAFAGIAAAYVRFGVEHPAHYRLMFGAELADNERYPILQATSDAAFAVLTGSLERGQASGQVLRGPVRDQALAAWSLVHGLTTLVTDQRVSFLGVTTDDAERHARLAATALFDGLSAKKA
jgi:hypothetical protein